jgi:hypothetical protein
MSSSACHLNLEIQKEIATTRARQSTKKQRKLLRERVSYMEPGIDAEDMDSAASQLGGAPFQRTASSSRQSACIMLATAQQRVQEQIAASARDLQDLTRAVQELLGSLPENLAKEPLEEALVALQSLLANSTHALISDASPLDKLKRKAPAELNIAACKRGKIITAQAGPISKSNNEDDQTTASGVTASNSRSGPNLEPSSLSMQTIKADQPPKKTADVHPVAMQQPQAAMTTAIQAKASPTIAKEDKATDGHNQAITNPTAQLTKPKAKKQPTKKKSSGAKSQPHEAVVKDGKDKSRSDEATSQTAEARTAHQLSATPEVEDHQMKDAKQAPEKKGKPKKSKRLAAPASPKQAQLFEIDPASDEVRENSTIPATQGPSPADVAASEELESRQIQEVEAVVHPTKSLAPQPSDTTKGASEGLHRSISPSTGVQSSSIATPGVHADAVRETPIMTSTPNPAKSVSPLTTDSEAQQNLITAIPTFMPPIDESEDDFVPAHLQPSQPPENETAMTVQVPASLQASVEAQRPEVPDSPPLTAEQKLAAKKERARARRKSYLQSIKKAQSSAFNSNPAGNDRVQASPTPQSIFPSQLGDRLFMSSSQVL